MELSRLLLLLLLTTTTTTITTTTAAYAVPIWENLSRQDKMGQIMYVFHRLVDRSCTFSHIPDCNHVLALHGMANLINMKDSTLNSLDPIQQGAPLAIWKELMTTPWELPEAYRPVYLDNLDEITNEITTGLLQSFPNTSPIYPNYPPLPNALNTPQRAVSDPHPYAVKVPPPPGFNPNSKEQGTKDQLSEDMDRRSDGGADDGSVLLPLNDQKDYGTHVLPQWSDGDNGAITSDFEDGLGLILGHQDSNGDVFASWTDVNEMVNGERMTDSRLGLENAGLYMDIQGVPDTVGSWQYPGGGVLGDISGNWQDPGVYMESQVVPESTFGPWDVSGQFVSGHGVPGDRFGGLEDAGMYIETQAVPESTFAPWEIPGQFVNGGELPDNRFGNWEDAGMYMDNEGPLEYMHGSWQEAGGNLNNQRTQKNRLSSPGDSFKNQNNAGDGFGTWTFASEILGNRRQSDMFTSWMGVGGVEGSQDAPQERLGDADGSTDDQDIIDRFASWRDVEKITNNPGTPKDQFLEDRLGDLGRNEETTQDQETTEDRFASWKDVEDIVSPPEDQVVQVGLGNWGHVVDFLQGQKPTDQLGSWKDVTEIQSSQNTPDYHLQNFPNADQTKVHYNRKEEENLQAQKPTDPFASWKDVTEIQNSQGTPSYDLLNFPDTRLSTQTQAHHNTNEDILQSQKPVEDRFASWKDVTEIQNSQNTPPHHLQNYPDTVLSAQTQAQYNSDPYEIWANSGMQGHAMPAGLVPTADFEPLMVESKVVESRVPSPTVFTSYDDDEMRRRRRGTIRRGIYLPLHLLQ